MTETPTYPQLVGLRAAAQASVRDDHGFVDPAKLRRYEQLGRGHDWRISIIGHDNRPDLLELHMLLIAHDRDLKPPLPDWLIAKRAHQRAERAAVEEARRARIAVLNAEWAALAAALPVPVGAAYNYSGPNHLENWTQGADHIIVLADLVAGRLHRAAGDALCTTPSNARQQIFCTPDPVEQRRASCKTCIRTACRITGLTATQLLNR